MLLDKGGKRWGKRLGVVLSSSQSLATLGHGGKAGTRFASAAVMASYRTRIGGAEWPEGCPYLRGRKI